MNYTFNKILFLGLILLACSKEAEKEPYNIFGNTGRISSYEKSGRFWTGIASLEKVKCSDTSGFITYPLSLKDNAFVTSTTDGWIVCFKHINLLWEYKLQQGEYVVSNIVASPKQEIFFITNFMNVYLLTRDGEKIWKLRLDDSAKFFSTLLATRSGVYFTTSTGNLYKIGYDGKIKWKILLPLQSTNCFAEASNGNIVLNLTHDKLGETDTVLFVDTSGKILFKRYFEGVRLIRTPVAWKDKVFVLGYKESNNEIVGNIFCLDTNGNLVWNKEFGIIPRYLSISEDGELFLILYNVGLGETLSTIYKLNSSGDIIAKQFITSTFYTPLFISQEIIGAIGYTKGNPVMVFFGKDLTLWKSIDLSKYPTVLNIPAILDDYTMFFVATSGNYLVRIDENPIIKMLPW